MCSYGNSYHATAVNSGSTRVLTRMYRASPSCGAPALRSSHTRCGVAAAVCNLCQPSSGNSCTVPSCSMPPSLGSLCLVTVCPMKGEGGGDNSEGWERG